MLWSKLDKGPPAARSQRLARLVRAVTAHTGSHATRGRQSNPTGGGASTRHISPDQLCLRQGPPDTEVGCWDDGNVHVVTQNMGPGGIEQGWEHVEAITLRRAQIVCLQDCRVSDRNKESVKRDLRRRYPDYQSFLTTRKSARGGKPYPLTLITLVLKASEPAVLLRDIIAASSGGFAIGDVTNGEAYTEALRGADDRHHARSR